MITLNMLDFNAKCVKLFEGRRIMSTKHVVQRSSFVSVIYGNIRRHYGEQVRKKKHPMS